MDLNHVFLKDCVHKIVNKWSFIQENIVLLVFEFSDILLFNKIISLCSVVKNIVQNTSESGLHILEHAKPHFPLL